MEPHRDTPHATKLRLYETMLRSRLFEESTARLWRDGLISGELHLGTGEEGIVAGVVTHLRDGDAMALDHRGTAPLLMRGADPERLLLEILGEEGGLSDGVGGHMHLFAPDLLAASSGIVGAAGPAAAGFGVAASQLRPGTLAVALFGEGAMNQGMLMESLNLAVAWRLPVLFVCKDDGWAITTDSATVTGGDLTERARSFGMPAEEVDGWDALAVGHAAGRAVERARRAEGPSFLRARCVHLEGHFLGDHLVSLSRRPVREMAAISGPLVRSATRRTGTTAGERVRSVASILRLIGKTFREKRDRSHDPVAVMRAALRHDEADAVDGRVTAEVASTVRSAIERLRRNPSDAPGSRVRPSLPAGTPPG